MLVDGFIPQIFCVETLFNFDEGQEMLPFVGASHCPAYLPHFAAGFGLGGELIGTEPRARGKTAYIRRVPTPRGFVLDRAIRRQDPQLLACCPLTGLCAYRRQIP